VQRPWGLATGHVTGTGRQAWLEQVTEETWGSGRRPRPLHLVPSHPVLRGSEQRRRWLEDETTCSAEQRAWVWRRGAVWVCVRYNLINVFYHALNAL
jgi:hypothetical protein